MILAITGSSHLKASVNYIRNSLIAHEIPLEKITKIICLDKVGVSQAGKVYALKNEISLCIFDELNDLIQHSDAIALFWDGVSKGALSTKVRARQNNKPIFETVLHGPNQAARKELGIYVPPKERLATNNKSNQKDINPGVLV